MKTWKNWPKKLLIFFFQQWLKSSPNLNSCSIKISHRETSLQWFWTCTIVSRGVKRFIIVILFQIVVPTFFVRKNPFLDNGISDPWNFVKKIVLTYCEKKNVSLFFFEQKWFLTSYWKISDFIGLEELKLQLEQLIWV